nr:MAG TPA: hypothetical protein [Caudoviricetes sp.]
MLSITFCDFFVLLFITYCDIVYLQEYRGV